MSQYENESICSECHAICKIVPMEEKEWHEVHGTNKPDVTKWNESNCCGADVRAYDEEQDGE